MNNVENMVESELIQRLKEGSQQAFDPIYRLYSKRLYAYCLQYVKVEMEAEEIV